MPSEPERPAATPYGPNTPAVRRFLQRFAALSSAEWDEAAAVYATLQRTPAFRSADRALSSAVARAGREPERDAVLGPLLQLVRQPEGAPGAAPPTDADRADGAELSLAPVAEAALAATLALVAHDILSPSAFATLYGPFAERIPLAALGLGR